MRSIALITLTLVIVASSFAVLANQAQNRMMQDAWSANLSPGYFYGGLIQPQTRDSTNLNSSATSLICGGTSGGKTHYLTSQLVPNQFKWYIRTPFPNATCMLRLSLGVNVLDDSSYSPIIPDNSYDVLPDGSFPCGRQGPIVETRQFTFNSSVSCDHCVVEWIWNTPYGQSRQCTDVMITSGSDTPCLGQCLNNGVCSNGKCICPKGYSGQFCNGFSFNFNFNFGWSNAVSIIFWVILAVIAVGGIFFCLYYMAQKRMLFQQQTQIYHTSQPGQPGYGEFDKEGVQAGRLARDV